MRRLPLDTAHNGEGCREVSRLCHARKTAYRLTTPCCVLVHAGRNVQGAFEYRDNKNHPIARATLLFLEELVFHTAETEYFEAQEVAIFYFE